MNIKFKKVVPKNIHIIKLKLNSSNMDQLIFLQDLEHRSQCTGCEAKLKNNCLCVFGPTGRSYSHQHCDECTCIYSYWFDRTQGKAHNYPTFIHSGGTCSICSIKCIKENEEGEFCRSTKPHYICSKSWLTTKIPGIQQQCWKMFLIEVQYSILNLQIDCGKANVTNLCIPNIYTLPRENGLSIKMSDYFVQTYGALKEKRQEMLRKVPPVGAQKIQESRERKEETDRYINMIKKAKEEANSCISWTDYTRYKTNHGTYLLKIYQYVFYSLRKYKQLYGGQSNLLFWPPWDAYYDLSEPKLGRPNKKQMAEKKDTYEVRSISKKGMKKAIFHKGKDVTSDFECYVKLEKNDTKLLKNCFVKLETMHSVSDQSNVESAIDMSLEVAAGPSQDEAEFLQNFEVPFKLPLAKHLKKDNYMKYKRRQLGEVLGFVQIEETFKWELNIATGTPLSKIETVIVPFENKKPCQDTCPTLTESITVLPKESEKDITVALRKIEPEAHMVISVRIDQRITCINMTNEEYYNISQIMKISQYKDSRGTGSCKECLDILPMGDSITFGCTSGNGFECCRLGQTDLLKKCEITQKWRGLSKEHISYISAILQRIGIKVWQKTQEYTPKAATIIEPSVNPRCQLLSGLPYSGVTLVGDYTSHYHQDTNNVPDGVTGVVNLIHPDLRDCEESPQIHILKQNNIGFNLKNGDLLLEYAKHEWHGTTRPQPSPDDAYARIGIVYFSHQFLLYKDHGNCLNDFSVKRKTFTAMSKKMGLTEGPMPKKPRKSKK